MSNENEEEQEFRELLNSFTAYHLENTPNMPNDDESTSNDDGNDEEEVCNDVVDDDEEEDYTDIYRSELYLNKAYRNYKYREEVSDSVERPKIFNKSKILKLLKPPEYESYDELSAKMVNCGSNEDIKILILEEGDGPLVPVDAEVLMHFAYYIENNDMPFDSTLKNNTTGAPKRIRLGKAKTLPGMEVGLTRVRGPKARLCLLLQPTVEWCPRTRRPVFIPVTTLVMIVMDAVIDVQAPVRYKHLPSIEKVMFSVTMPTVEALFYKGKKEFQKKMFEKAVQNYKQSHIVLQSVQPANKVEERSIKKLKAKAFVNLAVCYYMLNQPENIMITLKNPDLVPTDIGLYSKALFYLGRAYAMLDKPVDAIKTFQRGLKLEPANIHVNQALIDMKTLMAERNTNFNLEISASCRSSTRVLLRDLSTTNFDQINLPSFTPDENVAYLKEYAKHFTGFDVIVTGTGDDKIITVIKM